LQTDPSIAILDRHTDELGIDSLVAVDIRSWFIKELNVEMPILKILGGFTPAELVAEAQDKTPQSLVPNLGKEIDASLMIVARAQRHAAVVLQKLMPAESHFTTFDEEEEHSRPETVNSSILAASERLAPSYLRLNPASEFPQALAEVAEMMAEIRPSHQYRRVPLRQIILSPKSPTGFSSVLFRCLWPIPILVSPALPY
jgi:acyl carrier protein